MLYTRLDDGSTRPGWKLRLLLLRNRLVGNSAFQRWALSNPLTRIKARRHARALFDLTAGFVYSQVTSALVESDLLDALATRPRSEQEAAELSGLGIESARTLLRAAASLGLTAEAESRWTLGERGGALAGMPGLSDMIRHHRLLYADLADPLAMLRREGPGALASLWTYDDPGGGEEARIYSRLMTATQPMVAAQALAAYSFTRHVRLLDIGGGQGAFLREIGHEYPALGLGLFDRPAVIETIGDRDGIRLHAGSFLTDPLPGGYDLHSLVRVLHDHDDAAAMAILQASRRALPPGGRLLIVEPMAEVGRAPEGHAYFGFYLAAMRSGRPRTAAEIRAMLRGAGFARVSACRTPLPLVAHCLVAST
ncbi:methyltransferase [Sphingomonas rosea]|uniref:Methyltransferase n=1 Tax=Sphingomonas rosea TaxID=335605 RepID=A0ABP7U5C5_9SPHN